MHAYYFLIFRGGEPWECATVTAANQPRAAELLSAHLVRNGQAGSTFTPWIGCTIGSELITPTGAQLSTLRSR
jgi:hypothetical protein